MAFPDVVSREQWLEARRLLLTAEKEQTRRQDALNAQRRRLPMVRIEKKCLFGGPRGAVTLARMFGGGRQPIVHHIMFGPDWDEPCPSCRGFMDELSAGLIAHLHDRDTAFALASRAPRAKIEAYGRGNEYAPSLYTLLDLTALGRQEGWEEPKERAAGPFGG